MLSSLQHRTVFSFNNNNNNIHYNKTLLQKTVITIKVTNIDHNAYMDISCKNEF